MTNKSITLIYIMTNGMEEKLTRTESQHKTFQSINNATINWWFEI
jgi:hypothetical protein